MLDDIGTGIAMCRDSCDYFSICGGGEPVNKLAENGSFASTETTYCRMTKMRATDLVLDALDRVPAAGFDPGAIRRLAAPGPQPADRIGATGRSTSHRRTA
jgi:uncharacterized protein